MLPRLTLCCAVLAGAAAAQDTLAAKIPPPLTDRTRSWLTLQDVLASVERHYPPLLAALQDRVIAEADVTLAEGRFDVLVKGGYEGDYLGYYRNDTYRAAVEQATAMQGLSWFAGYQLGRGDYAVYDGKMLTDSLGQYKAGAKLPLFRDREIDSRRAEIQKALIGRRIADLGVDQQRLLIVQMATRRYFDWVAAGRRFEASKTVLGIAEQRDKQLRETAKLGQIPEIDVTDNRRAILARRTLMVEAERGLQQAAIELSLYYRDGNGTPQRPAETLLPPDFPVIRAIDESRLAEDIDLAMKRRPEIQRFAAQKDQVEVDRRLAQNQQLPGIDTQLTYIRESGDRQVRRGPNDLIASLVFEMPAQRRQARGREASALARLEQVRQREQFAREQVEAEVRDAHSALSAAHRRARLLTEELDVARQLEEAERIRFGLGDGTLFLVNLREQATFDTELRQVSAVNEYFRALAQYEYAIAEGLARRQR